MPIALDGIRTCISGIRAHSASDCTTTAGTPRVSRMKHFRHSPVSSIAKQSCMKDSNSYLRDRDVKHLQGPPLSRTKRVKERRKIELTVMREKSAHCSRRDMKHVQLSSLLLFLAPVSCGEAAVVRAVEVVENPNVKECLLEPATIEPAGSDVQPRVAVGGCTTKPEVLASEWQSNIVHTTGPSPSATERPKRRRRLPRSRKSTARMIANCDLRRTQDITRE